MDGIFETVKRAALIHKSGGGTGFAFSRLRPSGDLVGSTGGVASGPVSFMEVFNGATESVKQGGTRRGANMGILRIDHPDVLQFIDCKRVLADGPRAAYEAVEDELSPAARDALRKRLLETQISNFNISLAVTDRFMEALAADGEYELIHPRSGEIVKRLRARDVFDRMVQAAWETGDPGIVFIDRINAGPANPVPEMGPVEATNPCGEQPLYPNEACNLGALTSHGSCGRAECRCTAMAAAGGRRGLDWERMERTVRTAIRFLDDVITVNPVPDKYIDRAVKANRRVGLGRDGLGRPAHPAGDRLRQRGRPAPRHGDDASHQRVRRTTSRAGWRRSGGRSRTGRSSIYKDGRPQRTRRRRRSRRPARSASSPAARRASSRCLRWSSTAKARCDGQLSLEVYHRFIEMAKREGFWTEDLARQVQAHGTVRGLDERAREVAAGVRHGTRHRARLARAHAGGLPAAHRQRRL